MLPSVPCAGPNAGEYDEGQAHIRGAGAFENPQTLEGFVSFLRAGAEKLDAQVGLRLHAAALLPCV